MARTRCYPGANEDSPPLRWWRNHWGRWEQHVLKADLENQSLTSGLLTTYMPEGLDLTCEQRSESSVLPLSHSPLPHLALCERTASSRQVSALYG